MTWKNDEKQLGTTTISSWLQAAAELDFVVIHPFVFHSKDGRMATSVGVFIPDFGSQFGTLLTCRFDSDEVCDLADNTDYCRSALNPNSYEPYKRELYVETLRDWGWFGKSAPPNFYAD
jgi:hypothetical protein